MKRTLIKTLKPSISSLVNLNSCHIISKTLTFKLSPLGLKMPGFYALVRIVAYNLKMVSVI